MVSGTGISTGVVILELTARQTSLPREHPSFAHSTPREISGDCPRTRPGGEGRALGSFVNDAVAQRITKIAECYARRGMTPLKIPTGYGFSLAVHLKSDTLTATKV